MDDEDLIDPNMYDPMEDDPRYMEREKRYRKESRMRRVPQTFLDFFGLEVDRNTTLERRLELSQRFLEWQEEQFTQHLFRRLFQAVVFDLRTDDLIAAQILRREIMAQVKAQPPGVVDWSQIKLVPPMQFFGCSSVSFHIAEKDELGRYITVIKGSAGGTAGDGMIVAVREEDSEFVVDQIVSRWVN